MNRLLFTLLVAFGSTFSVYAQAITWTSNCANRSVCLNPGSCSLGNAVLWEEAVTSNCGSTKLTYIYRLDLDNNNTVDQTATADTFRMALPRGTHRLSWRASDACGRAASCTYTVTVEDCEAPALVCRGGSSTALSAPICREVFTADRFIQSLSDNCTPSAQIKKGVRRAGSGTGFPTADTLGFGNCDVGVNIVEVWAQDQKGRTNQCNTYILVQENSSVCPCVVDATIDMRGCVTAGNGKKLSQYRLETAVKTEPSGLPAFSRTFRQAVAGDSCYTFPLTKIPLGGPFRLTTRVTRPEAQPLDGLTTADIALISQHILNLRPFPNFYQVLAADVNQSQTVTTLDVVEIRRLILGISDTFTHTTPWRFIQPVANPTVIGNLAAVRDTHQTVVTDVRGNITVPKRNFIGLKMGDVNFSGAGMFNGQGAGDRAPLALLLEDRLLKPGEKIPIALRLPADCTMDAWQLALWLDPRALRLTAVEGTEAEDYASDEGGTVRLLWYRHPVEKTAGEALVVLHVEALQGGLLSEALRLAPKALTPELYQLHSDGFQERSPLTLQFQTGALPEHQLFAPQPNPFRQETTFGFQLTQPEEVRLDLLDMNGRLLASRQQEAAAGYGAITISSALLPQEGMYAYRLFAGKAVKIGKVFLQR